MAMETVLRDVPIQLMDPTTYSHPKPKSGCAACAALQRQIDLATDPRCNEFDQSKASDLYVQMARHQSTRGDCK